jgi:hypothetical protein
MMAVSLSSTTSTMPSPPVAPPRSSSLSPSTSGGQSQSTSSRSRSSKKGTHVHREVRFGNYILGQTLGEGEFGKVKLGWRRPEPGQTTGDGVQVLFLDRYSFRLLIVGRHQTHSKRKRRHEVSYE